MRFHNTENYIELDIEHYRAFSEILQSESMTPEEKYEPNLHDIGLTTMQTSFGHAVPVYDMERTICNLLRSRRNIEMQVFHVEKILRPYLEVLL